MNHIKTLPIICRLLNPQPAPRLTPGAQARSARYD